MTDETKALDSTRANDETSFLKAHDAERYRKAINWDDLETAANTFPELEQLTKKIIKDLLGYLPPDYLIIRHEPFLRALVNRFRGNQLTDDDFFDQAAECVKLIRNEEVSNKIIPENIEQLYHEYLPEHGREARKRLTGFLGYEPKPENSALAELLLRKAMASDNFYFPDRITNTDLQAITLLKYHEALLQHGRDAADASPLAAMHIRAQNPPSVAMSG